MNSDGQHKTGMTRKRSKSNATALHYLSAKYDARRAEAGKEHDSSLDCLPRETLLLIFANLQFPSRQCAAIGMSKFLVLALSSVHAFLANEGARRSFLILGLHTAQSTDAPRRLLHIITVLLGVSSPMTRTS